MTTPKRTMHPKVVREIMQTAAHFRNNMPNWCNWGSARIGRGWDDTIAHRHAFITINAEGYFDLTKDGAAACLIYGIKGRELKRHLPKYDIGAHALALVRWRKR